MRAPLAVCACACLAAGAAGCGSKPLSKAEYVKQADAICTSYAADQKKLGDPKSVKDIETIADKTKPLVQKQLKELRALKAPDSVKDDADDAYDLLDQQIPKIDDLVAAAKANDVTKIQSIAAAASKLDAQANAKAKAIGLKVCGSDR